MSNFKGKKQTLSEQNKSLLAEIERLKEENLKIRIPLQMSVEAFNWCVDQLNTAKEHFASVKEVPAKMQKNEQIKPKFEA